MTITVNGEAREVADGATIATLLAELGLQPRLIVVEHNRDILDRTAYDATRIREGDSLELVHFVGGG
jgi:thiamine biosynthesis protein ThiS